MAECIPLVFDTLQLSEEEKMARLFCQYAKDFFDGITGKIFVVPSLRKGRDMDLVIWMHFDKFKHTINTSFINNPHLKTEKEYKRRINRDIWFNSAMIVIELKKHNTKDSISIKNGKLYVKYGNEFKNASDQNFEQIFHLKSYLSERLGLMRDHVPQISNFIWLYRCNDKPIDDDELDNIIYGDINFNIFLEQICRLNPPVSFNEGNDISFSACKPEIIGLLDNYFNELRKEKANGLGLITRRKLDIILKKQIDLSNSQKVKDIGNKLTIIKGKPGTGKTIHLVHLAYHLKAEEYKPIILTFNKALVQDINRMMLYSGYGESIDIKTIHSFFYEIFHLNELIDPQSNCIDKYNQLFKELLELIGQDKGYAIRRSLNIMYDTVLIDEAQDCYELEKELLIKLFEYQNIVISIGNRQIVREKEINWTENIIRNDINIIKLDVSHRNKKDLVDFFNSFSNIHCELMPWDLKENRKLMGGRFILMPTSSYSKEFQYQLINELIEEKNSMYDLMFLTPSETRGNNYAEELCKKLLGWGIKSFNNTLIENKEKPFPIDEHRILNYQSCRGLEAWVVVCWNLDTITRNIETYAKGAKYNDLDGLKILINNWLLMIFTRAIDTLVLTFEDMNSEEAKIILDLANSASFSHMARTGKEFTALETN